MSGGGRQLGGRVDFCSGVDDPHANQDAPALPKSKASPPASSSVSGPALDSGGHGVGAGRGVGPRGTQAEFPRSADGEFLQDDVNPSLSPSLTYACVEEGLSKKARATGVRIGASPEDIGSADVGFADFGSADAEFAEATNTGARGGRLASHQQASPSPRCTLGWVEEHLERKKALALGHMEESEVLFVTWSVKLRRSAVCHIVGRGGRTLQRIEDFCGVFLALQDVGEQHSELLLWGSPKGVALAAFVVQTLEMGLHSILDSLGRLGL